jgi:hypothetical protein
MFRRLNDATVRLRSSLQGVHTRRATAGACVSGPVANHGDHANALVARAIHHLVKCSQGSAVVEVARRTVRLRLPGWSWMDFRTHTRWRRSLWGPAQN